MRFLCLLVMAVFASGASICEAGDDKACGAASACSSGSIGSSSSEPKTLKRIDTDYGKEGEGARGDEDFRGMEKYDTYDENTGLPDMVESDRFGDVE